MRLARVVLSLALGLCSFSSAIAATTVESFTPQGTVKGVRQVTARFSAPMVPFGDLRLADPFTIDCPQPGTGRWIDGGNWSYDFSRDLPAGVICRFELKPDLKDLAGQALGGERAFSFSTGGPAIVEAVPREGSLNLDEKQVFLLGLDAPAKPETIAANAWCRAEGINEKIGVRLLDGKERDDLLAQRKHFIDRYLTLYFKARGVLWEATLGLKNQRLDKLPIVALQCRQTLPAGAKMSLVWGAGIATDNGVANAEDQVLAYQVRPDFSAKFSCTRVNSRSQCIPFLPMSLDFTAPIRTADARAITLTGANGKVHRAQIEAHAARAEYVSMVTFKGPFPEKSAFTIQLPAGLKDDAGRALINQARFPLKVQTAEQPPLAKFPARFGIIELHGDRMLPVTLRNLEANVAARVMQRAEGDASAMQGSLLRIAEDEDRKILDWLKRLNIANSEQWVSEQDQIRQSVFKKADTPQTLSVPKPNGRRAFEVVGIPLKQPGFYVVELQSPKLGAAITEKGGPAYIQSAALVTNLAAHFKHGAESSLVWVTRLDNGQPVAGAQVALRDCNGKLLWQGKSGRNGVAAIAQPLPPLKCKTYGGSYFVSARLGDDMTFTLSDWDEGIQPWRFGLPTAAFNDSNIIAATVFDRTLLRAGETVHMKHFLRRHTRAGIDFAKPISPPTKLTIEHQGSDQKYELPLTWTPTQSAESNWRIPADARQGTYTLRIGQHEAGSFRVEAFRVPTMKALLQGPKMPLIEAERLDLDVQLNYLSGGAASHAPVKLRTLTQGKPLRFAAYEDFSFGGDDVKEGIEKDAPGFDDEPWYGGEEGAGGAAGSSPVQTRALTLDAKGAARIVIDKLPQAESPRDLLAELEYQDANGETLTTATRIPLWSSRYVVGLKPDGWALSKDDFRFQALVLDIHGKPVDDALVAVDFFERKTYSHRRRLIGGFYAYENSTEIKRLGVACAGRTDEKGLLHCAVKAPASGNLILRAVAGDEGGRAAYAQRDTWVAGDEDWWFQASDNDRIDVLPEKKRYEPGENATLQVRMPFRDATALITVEREGIIDTYVRRLSGKEPAISIPVKASYAPNVYVSVFVVRGRAAGIKPTALLDLGKPAWKMGIAPLRVGWQAHELNVRVETDKELYKTRDKAKVRVQVRRPDGSPPPAGAEIALAAVDAGLLELMPNDSWNLLEAMMRQRGLQVTTATAQMQVVGKRHFGRKAVAHGGGGGKSAARELFDTLLFWQARVALDAQGEASIEVPLNDSLTAFRIVAVANAGASLFGTGSTEIRSSQDLILLSGLPSVTREGDKLRAGFTLRNTTQAPLQVTLEATVTADNGKPLKLAPQSASVAPGQAQDIGWNFEVPAAARALNWEVAAKSADGAQADRLRVKQKVAPAVPVRIYQATLMQLDQPQNMTLQMPADALPGRGGMQTLLAPRLGDELPGVRAYMRDYPYTCFEQVASKAVALRDAALWRTQMNALPVHLDRDGLVKYFPVMSLGSDSLTAYLLSVAHEAGYEIPAQTKQRMEDGLIGFVQGRVIRHSALPTADVAIRKMAALEALSRSGKVTAELLESFAIEPNLWPTSAVIDWYLVLQRTSVLPKRDATLAQVEQILRSRLNLQGTTLGFSTERRDELWWLMISTDVNANRLLLAMLDNEKWRADMGRLARGALGRQHKGRWNTTVANAWGVLAMEKFSQRFESEAVTGSTSVNLGASAQTLDWAKQPKGGTLSTPWPQQRADLAIRHSGSGKPWATVQSLAAIPLKAPLSSGFTITKRIEPIEQKRAGVWSRGDVMRVRLELEAQSDMTWVVVDDPIPASASVLGTGLGRDSRILVKGEKREGWVWPAFEERSFEAFRAYYDFVPKGKWAVEYTVRLNNEGEFALPPTRVEAMYAPEMFGEMPNRSVVVKP